MKLEGLKNYQKSRQKARFSSKQTLYGYFDLSPQNISVVIQEESRQSGFILLGSIGLEYP
ncbi:hypothetical protein [Dapis sp. BLCC M229]|uniref:hypothetical protein n=1 Tax=Dapis sp. BLCC M229 TaxID=3400188 RepID=UPI003CED35F2